MKPYDIASVRERFRTLSTRANEQLGMFNSESIGIGRYVAGKSPWERHSNGDELLLVTDGEVQVEILDADGTSTIEALTNDSLFVVPKGKWHQLTATDNVNIFYISPSEDGVERTRGHPFDGGVAPENRGR